MKMSTLFNFLFIREIYFGIQKLHENMYTKLRLNIKI